MLECSENLSAILENHVPPLEELKTVIEGALSANFATVFVDVRKCPDLKRDPFHQTSSGFGHRMVIAEVGGPANLTPVVQKDKIYDIETISAVCGKKNAYVFGPGAGPYPIVGRNCEMVANANLKEKQIKTVTLRNCDKSRGYISEYVSSPKFALMANLALSTSNVQSQVVYFKCEVRTGSANLTNCIRDALQKHYSGKLVSLAGFFIIKDAKTKVHIMPDFPNCPFKDNNELNEWLKYYDMKSPLICATVMHSEEADRHLRLEHTHCFSEHGDGGHYHYDITPKTVVYEGYLAAAEKVYRIDEVYESSSMKSE
ncbi:unnamed protein product [Auanema sp. JU1783]|nr:unnamed protein product [Auanema sp. JU1783]